VQFVALLLCVIATGGARGAEPNRVYDANCALCHQKGGVGLRGQFPRLAGRAAAIAATDTGLHYLTEVVLFGMMGQIEVDGVQIVGVMPSFAALSDDDLASVLNYATHLDEWQAGWKKRPLVTAEDVRVTRAGQQLSAAQVRANRDSPILKSALGPIGNDSSWPSGRRSQSH
jgi:mono/diheme cytochrome c family protein